MPSLWQRRLAETYFFDVNGRPTKQWITEGSYREIEAPSGRARPGATVPPISPEATAFAKSGLPS